MTAATTKANRVITVEQAELKTASVEIRHVVVNARKMTLSVFRQIPEEDILVLEGGGWRLAGVPWGLVNYFWGSMNANRHHVLWQKGKELRRSLVVAYNPLPVDDLIDGYQLEVLSYFTDRNLTTSKTYNESMTAVIVEVPGVYPDRLVAQNRTERRGYKPEKVETDLSGLERMTTTRPPYSYADDEAQNTYNAWHREAREMAMRNAERAEHTRKAAIHLETANLTKRVRDLIEYENKNRAAYNTLAADLAALPQLFIAV